MASLHGSIFSKVLTTDTPKLAREGVFFGLMFDLCSPSVIIMLNVMGLLQDTWNYGLRMRRECRERFPRHRGSAIPTCITERASRTCSDVGIASQQFPLKSEAGKTFPAFPVHAQPTIRGPYREKFDRVITAIDCSKINKNYHSNANGLKCKSNMCWTVECKKDSRKNRAWMT